MPQRHQSHKQIRSLHFIFHCLVFNWRLSVVLLLDKGVYPQVSKLVGVLRPVNRYGYIRAIGTYPQSLGAGIAQWLERRTRD